MAAARVWLLAGASGTGKSTIAYPLARRLRVPIVELDDIVEALLAMTTEVQLPVLHYWRTHPEASQQSVEAIVERQIAVAHALIPAVEAIIANHLETDTSVLLEGDYLLPSTAVQASFAGQPAAGRVSAIVLIEPDRATITRNLSRREPAKGEQTTRAAVSREYGNWLANEAVVCGVPIVEARPWPTAEARVLTALERSPRPPDTRHRSPHP